MGFIIYDIILFALAILAVAFFFHQRRKNFKIEGPFYLYRTKVGIKFIEWTSKRFSKTLKYLQYPVIASGYFLMFFGLWFIIKLAYVYLTSPYLAKELKVPVIFPLVPYLPEIFKLDFLPPFYFIYWVIILAIIAIPHEFAHGIYARLHKIKVHSTGFGFLRIFKFPTPFLAAFVEPDEKQMAKSRKLPQLAIISAGTFANIIVAIIFTFIIWAFITLTLVPSGVIFNTYSTSVVSFSDVTFNNTPLLNLDASSINLSSGNIAVKAQNHTFWTSPISLQNAIKLKPEYLAVYEDTPAFNAKLSGAITYIDGKKTNSYDSLRNQILSHKPGDQVIIKTLEGEKESEYNLTLGEKDGKAYLGVGVAPIRSSGLTGLIYSFAAKIKDPSIYYESKWGDFGIFIYDLLWWIIIVSISVALMNMLPLGVFDGGRFFYLTIAGLTGSDKIGHQAYKIATWLMLGIFALLMLKWVFIFF